MCIVDSDRKWSTSIGRKIFLQMYLCVESGLDQFTMFTPFGYAETQSNLY